jgi:hypothetical protein
MQNSALGALLAAAHFPANPLAVVPCALSACVHSVMGSMLAAYWRTRAPEEEAEEGSRAGKPAAARAAAPAEPTEEERQRVVRVWVAAWRMRTGGPGL